MTSKPCRRCGSLERYSGGDCKPCAIRRAKLWAQANRAKKLAAKTAWIKRNPLKAAASRAAWYDRHKSEQRVRTAQYYRAHRTALLFAGRTRRQANPEKERQRRRAWYVLHKEQRRHSVRAWAVNNTDRRKQITANWAKAHPDLRRIHKQNRRRRVGGGRLTRGLVKQLMQAQSGCCVYCGRHLAEYHIDHRVPLALGGPHCDENIQLLCPPCNLRKGSKSPETFAELMSIKWKC